jgi:hypothetical protein
MPMGDVGAISWNVMPIRDAWAIVFECYTRKRHRGRLCWNVMPIGDVGAIVLGCYAHKTFQNKEHTKPIHISL